MAIVRPKPPMRPAPPTNTYPESASASKPPARPAPLVAAALPVSKGLVKEVNETYGRKRPIPKQETKPENSTPATRPPASELAVPAGQSTDAGRPEGYFGGEDEAEASGQLTRLQLQKLNIAERYELWKRLNRDTDSTVFVTLLKPEELPKRMAREYPAGAKPNGKGVLFCCYCAEWSIFTHFAYVGSDKCVGCGISTKDYYNRNANKLWKAEL